MLTVRMQILNPDAPQTERVLERCVAKGLITESAAAAALDRRHAARLASAAAAQPQQQPPAGAPAAEPPSDASGEGSAVRSKGPAHHADVFHRGQPVIHALTAQ
jgi:hypothetical protein